MVQWTDHIIEGLNRIVRDFMVAEKFEPMLEAAGFEDVHIACQEWPIGTWAKGRKNKEIGLLTAENLKDGAKNSMSIFTSVLGWQLEEFEVLNAKIAEEIQEGKWHLYTKV